MNISRRFLLAISILFLLFLIPFLRSFGGIDIIGIQWFILPLFLLSLFIYYRKSLLTFEDNLINKSYVVFVFFCLLSFFYSYNIYITLIDFTRVVTTYFLFIFFSIILVRFKPSFLILSMLISLVLFLESLYSIYPLLYEFAYFLKGQTLSLKPNFFIGIAANKNITSASLALKFPFLIYLFYSIKSSYFKYLLLIPIYFVLTSILFLNTRSVFLSISIFFFLFLLFILFFKRKFILNTFFLLSVVLISLLTNLNFSLNDSISQASTISVSSGNSSGRFELWSNALDFFVKHPIIGCGLGNWKVESLPYWSKLQSGYIVPYHAHNDYLEILTELGIFGFLSYLSIFIIVFYYNLKSFILNQRFSTFIVFSSFFVYSIDAFFNFPLERTIMQIPFAFLLATTYFTSFSNE